MRDTRDEHNLDWFSLGVNQTELLLRACLEIDYFSCFFNFNEKTYKT